MTKISEDLLEWRRKQKRGAIMKPSTFEKIKRKAAAAGYENPEAVAGAAYWRTAKAKYKEAKAKMPTPRRGESKNAFIHRCIPYVVRESNGKVTGSHAVAKCFGIWRQWVKTKRKNAS